jgi:hypothetical protein
MMEVLFYNRKFWTKSEDLISREQRYSSVGGFLPSMCKDLGLNLSNTKQKQK